MNRGRRDLIVTSLCTVATLLAVDAVLDAAFRMPSDARRRPSPFAYYFDYGRSLEAKFREIVRDHDTLSAPFAREGWLEPPQPVEAPGPGRRRVLALGQSFTYQVMTGLMDLDSTLAVDRRGGPSSPPSHLYALWQGTPRDVRPDIAIFGVLASSLRGMNASTAATWQFEVPPAFTYPRYHLDAAGALVAGPLPVRSLDDLRAALRDPHRLRAWEAQLARDDDWFDPFLWRESWLDRSVFARLLRRAWYQRGVRQRQQQLHGPDGFAPDLEAIPLIRAMLAKFVEGCRAEGTLPVVLLIEDRGFGDHLAREFGADLERLGATWLATHECVDPKNPDDGMPGGHFSLAANRRIAAELLRRIRLAPDLPAAPEDAAAAAVAARTLSGQAPSR